MTLMNTDHTFALVLISAEYQQIVMLTEHEDSSQESKLEFQGTDNKGKEINGKRGTRGDRSEEIMVVEKEKEEEIMVTKRWR